MTGSKRREELINTIKSSTSPISGKTLAQLYDVSRQVIVQDIALLRTAGYEIISTNLGYILNAPHTITRVFKVSQRNGQSPGIRSYGRPTWHFFPIKSKGIYR